MIMLSVSPAQLDNAAGAAPPSAHVAQMTQLVVRDDVRRSFARRLDGQIVWSMRDLARFGFNVRLQGASLLPPTPTVVTDPQEPARELLTRSATETAAALAAIDTRSLSLDEAIAEFGFPDDGPISGAWQSEERRLPRST